MRVSTEEQAEKGYSMQAQRSEAESKAVELGCSREDIFFFSDEGISGSILERPQLMTALNLLKKEGDALKYFICYDSSRLSRNASHQLILIDEIKRCGAQLVFLKNNYQDNAEGRFQLTVMAAVDEYERARLKLRTEMGKQAKASQHKLTHNPGLYGYSFNSITDKLTVNEEHAKNLKHIFYLLTEERKSSSEIAEELNASEVESPRMKKWTRNTVRRILSNPSYLGTLYIRRYDTRECHLNRFRSKGEKIKIRERPRSEWIPVDIPQIIDRETWETAQDILKKARRTGRRRLSAEYMLESLIQCGICGSSLKGKSIKKNGITYRYYICAKKYGTSTEKCQSRLIRAGEAEEAVWNYICKRMNAYVKTEADLKKLMDKYICEKELDIENIKCKKEKAKEERERIMTIFQKGFIDEDEMCTRLGDNEKKLKALDAAMEKENEHMAGNMERLGQEWKEEKLPYIIQMLLKNMSNTEKEQLMHIMIDEINVADNVITIIERP